MGYMGFFPRRNDEGGDERYIREDGFSYSNNESNSKDSGRGIKNESVYGKLIESKPVDVRNYYIYLDISNTMNIPFNEFLKMNLIEFNYRVNSAITKKEIDINSKEILAYNQAIYIKNTFSGVSEPPRKVSLRGEECDNSEDGINNLFATASS